MADQHHERLPKPVAPQESKAWSHMFSANDFWGIASQSATLQPDGGFLKWGYPPSHLFEMGIFQYKPSILGYPLKN